MTPAPHRCPACGTVHRSEREAVECCAPGAWPAHLARMADEARTDRAIRDIRRAIREARDPLYDADGYPIPARPPPAPP